jgi:periplasmic protein TonB
MGVPKAQPCAACRQRMRAQRGRTIGPLVVVAIATGAIAWRVLSPNAPAPVPSPPVPRTVNPVPKATPPLPDVGANRPTLLGAPPISWNDYPPAAQREGREGTVGFSIEVDTNGRPSGCDVTASSGHADLDEATCRLLLSRARFAPARDGNEVAVVSRYSSRVRWQIDR